MSGRVTAIVGAQYGSEGKGAIAAHVANEYDVHVRVGSPNAGHTIYWQDQKHVMQSIPCGWINPKAAIVIGRGALLNMRLLMSEIEHIEQFYPNFKDRLVIDANAGVLDERFHEEEGGVNGAMHLRIGSTGEGVGPARIARLQRDPSQFRMFRDVADEYHLSMCMYDNTPARLEEWRRRDRDILIEGTQGSALSLLHSFWPYCTSIDTNVSAMLSEIGMSPFSLTDVILVARTYPIRVAGNSGPMKGETSWECISGICGKHVEERTTVTKKVRRVGEWDDDLIENAILLNGDRGGTRFSIALTFADYVDPKLYGTIDANDVLNSEKLQMFIHNHPAIRGKVRYVGTGPRSVVEAWM